MRKKIKFIEQNEHSECGLSCLAMMFNYLNIETTLNELRDKYGVPRGGNNLLHLQTICEDYNLIGKAYKIDCNQFCYLKLPCICYWDNNHFIIIEKIGRSKIYIIDPATGRKKIDMVEFTQHFSGVIFTVENINNIKIKLKKENGSGLMGEIKATLKREYSKFIMLFFGMTLLQITTIITPMITQYIIDSNIMNLGVSFIIKLTYLSIALFITFYILQLIRGIVISKLQYIFNNSLMDKFMEKIANLSYKFFVNRSTGDLIFRTNLINYIQQILSQNLIKTIIDIMFFFVYIILMVKYSPILTFITLIIASLIVFFSVLSAKRYLELNDKEMSLQSKQQSIIVELFEGMETIKSLNAEKQFIKRWKSRFSDQQKVLYKKNKVSVLYGGIPQTIQFIFPVMIYAFGIGLILNQELTIGQLVSFSAIAALFFSPLITILDSYSELIVVKSYFAKINEILIEKNQIDKPDMKEDCINKIEFRNVSFKYSAFEENVLQNINFTVKRNEKIAIVGQSGSGKSTLLKLLASLYEPSNGSIFINENSLMDYSQSSYRKMVGLVNQKTSVFNSSLYDNIVMNADVSQDLLKHVLDVSMVDEMVKDFPSGLMTQISQEGMNLSGGQLQKIAFARTLIRQPDLLLLDEPTSSLDNISENKLINYIKKSDMTCILVSHRLNTIKGFDRIIVMEKGRIVEEGTHEFLINKKGLYYRIYSDESTL